MLFICSSPQDKIYCSLIWLIKILNELGNVFRKFCLICLERGKQWDMLPLIHIDRSEFVCVEVVLGGCGFVKTETRSWSELTSNSEIVILTMVAVWLQGRDCINNGCSIIPLVCGHFEASSLDFSRCHLVFLEPEVTVFGRNCESTEDYYSISMYRMPALKHILL